MLESVIEGYPKDGLSLYLGSGILKVLSRVISKTARVFTSVVVFGQVSFWLSKDDLSLYRNAQEGYPKDDLSLYLVQNIQTRKRVIPKTTRVFTSCRISKHVRGLSQRLLESLPRVNNYCLILF